MLTLIFVFWIVAISSILAFNTNYTSLWHYNVIFTASERIKYYPEALIILKLAKKELKGFKCATRFKVIIENRKWNVEVTDGGSGFNPNELHESEFKNILKFFCNLHEGVKLSIIIDSFLDWTDRDSFRRLNGAEEDFYKENGKNYKPRNGQILDKRELLYIRGFDLELYKCIGPLINVYGNGKFSLNWAPLSQLKALGISSSILKEIEEMRKENREEWRTLLSEIQYDIRKWVSLEPSGIYKISIHLENSNVNYSFLWDDNKKEILTANF